MGSITCKRGLHQGDPASPYLFLLVGDILQRLIQQDDVLEHPLVGRGRPPVLQYADDTIIILWAGVATASRLKLLLDQFAAATGLVINFSKSTLVPMYVDEAELAEISSVLGCCVQGFPQTYLGLPLSCDKLRLEDFEPMIAKIDKYLAGWCATLLSLSGRLVLIDAVLSAIPVYAMGALELPAAALRAVDALRRAFLWSGGDWASGAQCLVAWTRVCRPKSEGGLGVKDLAA